MVCYIFLKSIRMVNIKFRIVTHWGERSQCDTEKKLNVCTLSVHGLEVSPVFGFFLLCFVIYIVVAFTRFSQWVRASLGTPWTVSQTPLFMGLFGKNTGMFPFPSPGAS